MTVTAVATDDPHVMGDAFVRIRPGAVASWQQLPAGLLLALDETGSAVGVLVFKPLGIVRSPLMREGE